MQNKEEVTGKLKQMIIDLFEVSEDKINNDLEFINLEEWDSLTQVRFVVAVENEFSVRFEDDEINDLKHFGATVKLIHKKLIT